MPEAVIAVSSMSWSGLSDITGVLLVAMFIIAGAFFGYALRGLVGRWKAEAIEKRMRIREEEAEAEVKARLKEADIAARAAVVKAREEFETSTKRRRDELDAIEARLTDREEKLDAKSAMLDSREERVKSAAAAAEAKDAAATGKLRTAEEGLERLAGLTRDEARKQVMADAGAELREDVAALTRRILENARDDAERKAGEVVADAIHERKAGEVVADAIQRCAVSHASELMTTTVHLPGEGVKGRIVGRDGRNIRALEAATGVTMLVDDVPDAVVLSSFDPVRREIARRALKHLVSDGRIHPGSIEDAVKNAAGEVDGAAAEAGAEAAAEARVSGLPSEIVRMMGRLSFRTSFSQNVLRHSVEVALLMGRMAEELSLDSAKARRIGFLHDIGKALDSDRKGAHAALGAEFLKAHGEDGETVLAVAAHHPEAKLNGGVYGVLCSAADAISSSRPGARQETVDIYVERLRKREDVVKSHPGVLKSYAVQAGRDLRVVVDPGSVSDADAQLLARDICREISATIQFPGQIRVTVVREMRITEYAK